MTKYMFQAWNPNSNSFCSIDYLGQNVYLSLLQ